MKSTKFDPLLQKAIWHTHLLSELKDVNDTGKDAGKILKYNAVTQKWEVANDNDTTYTAGDGINITAENEIQNTDKGSDVDLSGLLKLDQSTPQTITNGIPKLEATRTIDENNELVDKIYVDTAVSSLGMRFYALSDVDGDTGYYLTSMTPSEDATATIPASGVVDNQLLGSWISPVGATLTKLIAGLYDFQMYAERTSGTRTFRIYWKLFELKSDDSEVEISMSPSSNEITSKRKVDIFCALSTDYVITAGSRIVGKIYADIGTTGVAPNVALYIEGDEDSHWQIPTATEILDDIYVKKAGDTMSGDLDLGDNDLLNPGAGHNSFADLQGGSIGEYNHITDAELTVLQDTSGVNTGDQDLSDYIENPMTTAGDIIYGGVDGDPTRLGIGDDDQVLTLASGVPIWADSSGGASWGDSISGTSGTGFTIGTSGNVTETTNCLKITNASTSAYYVYGIYIETGGGSGGARPVGIYQKLNTAGSYGHIGMRIDTYNGDTLYGSLFIEGNQSTANGGLQSGTVIGYRHRATSTRSATFLNASFNPDSAGTPRISGIRMTWGANFRTTTYQAFYFSNESTGNYHVGTGNDGSFCSFAYSGSGTALYLSATVRNTSGTVYAMDFRSANPSTGTAGGIDFSTLSTSSPIFKFPANATDPTSGGALGRIPIDIDGTIRYLAYY